MIRAAVLVFTFCFVVVAGILVVIGRPHSSTHRQSPTVPALLGDLNSATEFELEEIPGLGPADAETIIENRPYRSRDELLAKQIVPEDLFEKIKDNLSPR
ncbi:MAG: helix-hairpin-helix domain-containing protein [Acidobacteriota bacterium]|nr:helix-hairpin-helix domain-containing protein [Acidobacteriota bacterium]